MEGKGKGDGHQFTNTAGRKSRIPEPVLVSKLTYSEQQGPSRARTGPGKTSMIGLIDKAPAS